MKVVGACIELTRDIVAVIADFRIHLLRPETLTQFSFMIPEDELATSRLVDDRRAQQFLSYKAPKAGRYFIQVRALESSIDGTYALHATTGPLWSIARPSVPSFIRRGTWFNITGTIRPGYLYDGKPVVVHVQKRVNGRWSRESRYNLSHRTAPYDIKLERCRYGASAKLSAGRWRARASIGKAGVMGRRYTSWREFTVR